MTNKQFNIWFSIVTIAVATVLLVWMGLDMNGRIEALERVCHGQCKYGDAACAKRCEAAGHCEF